MGAWVALVTVGGAIVGLPFFLWLDPLAVLCGAVNTADFSHSRTSLFCRLTIIALLSMALPHIWCTKICPLGGFQDLCAGLGNVYRRLGRASKPAQTGPSQAAVLGRRSFVGIIVGSAVGLAGKRVLARTRKRLRPPGAVEEGAYEGLCIRCGNCVASCPTGIIHPDVNPPGPSGYMAPRIVFDDGHGCESDCNACGTSCPTGAITAFPLEDKQAHAIGTLQIDDRTCILVGGENCGVCIWLCPYDALGTTYSQETWSDSISVNVEQCNGCGLCISGCPMDESAISVRPA
jgi:ferredoxin